MGLFGRFKKEKGIQQEKQRIENYPELLTAKLLFKDKANINPERILEILKSKFAKVENPENGKALLYFFPEIQVRLSDASIPAQCTVLIADESNPNIEVANEAFQQNWSWKEGNDIAASCKYEVLISDLMTRALDYKTRFNLFSNFLSGVTEATSPQIVYSLSSQKLVKPSDLLDSIRSKENKYLEAFINVRLYNITNVNEGELLMDTLGLHIFGLPDFQIRFSSFNPGQIASLLLNYGYYEFEQGDIFESGNTIQGIDPGSKWKCERQISLVAPQRVVINIGID